MSMILVDESKKGGKILTLSSALAEFVVDSKEDKKIQVIVKGLKRKRWKKKTSKRPDSY